MSEIWADIEATAAGNEHLERVEPWLEADNLAYILDQVLMFYPTVPRRFGTRWNRTLERNGMKVSLQLAYGRLERRAGRMNVDVCYDFDAKHIDEFSQEAGDSNWTRMSYTGRGHGSATFDQEGGNLVCAIEVGEGRMRLRYESPESTEPEIIDTCDRYRQQTICLTPEERVTQKARRKAEAVAGGK